MPWRPLKKHHASPRPSAPSAIRIQNFLLGRTVSKVAMPCETTLSARVADAGRWHKCARTEPMRPAIVTRSIAGVFPDAPGHWKNHAAQLSSSAQVAYHLSTAAALASLMHSATKTLVSTHSTSNAPFCRSCSMTGLPIRRECAQQGCCPISQFVDKS